MSAENFSGTSMFPHVGGRCGDDSEVASGGVTGLRDAIVEENNVSCGGTTADEITGTHPMTVKHFSTGDPMQQTDKEAVITTSTSNFSARERQVQLTFT